MIVHIMVLDKFIPPFIEFVKDNFDSNEHKFVIMGAKRYKYGLKKDYKIFWVEDRRKLMKVIKLMDKSKKIILHGLWDQTIVEILYEYNKLLKKSYWVIWGGDFYFPERQSWINKEVIKKMGHFVTYIKGDYELVKQWYGAKGKYHECLMYLSNIFNADELTSYKKNNNNFINIQVGNSADPTNNHIEVFEKLLTYKKENMKIYVPLSYGDSTYANEIINIGKTMFKENFIALTDFMNYSDYIKLLSQIDIAIFNHNRQQAMGNIITLLGMGKKVYMKKNITSWQLFEMHGIKVYDTDNLDLEPLEEEIRIKNYEKVKRFFSQENLKNQLNELFDYEKK